MISKEEAILRVKNGIVNSFDERQKLSGFWISDYWHGYVEALANCGVISEFDRLTLHDFIYYYDFNIKK